ncbi:hypothetical protein VNO80_10238 [Phaseolus coccineus]|uniref:Uncharacterized protein n=1 Tax=Phaseolus coccineus TaxID=3886 RepID=A0AAN9ND29_PHACN
MEEKGGIERVKRGGNDGLLETVRAAVVIAVRENEANNGEEVAINAKGIKELAELGSFFGCRLPSLCSCEEAIQHTKFGLLHHHLNFEEASQKFS